MPLQNKGLLKSGLMGYRLIITIVIVFFSSTIFANKKNEFLDSDIVLDFRTMHIWRGIATSYSPTFEPTFEVSRNNYTTGIWFAQSLDGNYTELDLYFTYTFKNFSFTIYDYYCPPSIGATSPLLNLAVRFS